MKITFLGTGNSQGIPVIGSKNPICLSKNKKDKRLRSSILIEIKKKFFIIDCTPDFRYQMLRNNLEKIDAIFITHEHYDHIGGLEDLRPLNFKENLIQKIPVYGLYRVLKNLQKRFFYIFFNKKKENIKTLQINFIKIEKFCNNFSISNIQIYPLLVWHGLIPILGYRIKNFAYITDASRIPIQTIHKIKGIDILILNILRKNKNEKKYIELSKTLKIIQIIRPKKTYLTHIGNQIGFHDKIQNQLPKNIFLAYDGLIIKLI